MTQYTMAPDDLPAASALDEPLGRELAFALSKYFYQACDGVIQALLMSCEWSITAQKPPLTLMIVCPDLGVRRRVLNHLVALTTSLGSFSSQAKICICLPLTLDDPLEISINEISVYGDFL
jgi:hypothetical protein